MNFSIFFLFKFLLLFLNIKKTEQDNSHSKLPRIEIQLDFDNKTKQLTSTSFFSSENTPITQSIDISSSKSWINDKSINMDLQRQSYESFTYQGLNPFTIFGESHGAKITLKNQKDIKVSLPQYEWFIYHSEQGMVPNTGCLALGRTFETEEDDLIISLYKKQKIIMPVFSISYLSDKKGGILGIGDIAEILFEYREYNSFISVIEQDEKWRSNLTYIFFGDLPDQYISNIDIAEYRYIITQNFIIINYPAYFSTIDKYIVVPSDFIDYLERYYFRKYKFCSKVTKDGNSIIECNKEKTLAIIDTLPNINFVFDGVAYIIEAKNLFEESETSKDMLTFVIVSYKNNTEWIMGYYFMRNFFITFFRDTPTISIFSLLNKAYVILDTWSKKKTNNIIKNIIHTIIAFSIIGLMLLLSLKLL
jgi:hypothetical protein